MKNFYLLSCLCLLFACQATPEKKEAAEEEPTESTPAVNSLTDEEKAAGWQLLFDGISIDQWKGYGKEGLPAQGWSVKDDALVIEKSPSPRPADFGGDIITKEPFGNFELKLDFMISDTANSGIFYFVTEEEGSAMWHNAPEYQILDNATYLAMGQVTTDSKHLTGDNYDMESGAGDYMNVVGEWNTARIVHQDGKVEHWLNGKKCLAYQVGSEEWKSMLANSKFKEYPGYGQAKQGHLGLQDHDHEVRFRNIKIRNL